jgi:hypothetical protein
VAPLLWVEVSPINSLLPITAEPPRGPLAHIIGQLNDGENDPTRLADSAILSALVSEGW